MNPTTYWEILDHEIEQDAVSAFAGLAPIAALAARAAAAIQRVGLRLKPVS
ncbi:hypothetical protein ACWEQG_23565 [Microbispora sp. NPDC004025]